LSADAHFAAFSFVDRITAFEPGQRARAVFAVPAQIERFPSCLVAEAVGQLAAWVAMDAIGFRGRPVAALANETTFHAEVRPGDMLELAVEIEHCDDEAVAYAGSAQVAGKRVIELVDCLGPMLPVADFDAPEALAGRLELLRGDGAPPGRFGGVEPARIEPIAGEPGAALLHVPAEAPYFADHFPRRPVFPATLMLDALIGLAMRVAPPGHVPAKLTHVKVRSFTEPGAVLRIEAVPAAADATRIQLSVRAGDRTVATARLQTRPEASS
jgi:3-hydroxymyristoyl/3-hydroxydecanoyl-(acyl carrier protein) dehydratase